MSSWLYTIGYVALSLYTYRMLYPLAVKIIAYSEEAPDPFERGLSSLVSMIVCTMWPLVIAFVLIFKFCTPTLPSERLEALREREAAIRERERNIRRMEQELELE